MVNEKNRKDRRTKGTIDKAIKILEGDLEDKVMPHKAGVREAEQLGLEALKVVVKARSRGYSFASILLPGEDPE